MSELLTEFTTKKSTQKNIPEHSRTMVVFTNCFK
jgi:hypothetical protein